MSEGGFDHIDQELRDWEIASHRAKIVQSVICRPRPMRPHVELAASEHGVSTAMIYRWIAAYTKQPEVKTLLPKRRGPVSGRTYLDPDSEDTISETIKTFYTKHPKIKFSKLHEEVVSSCRKKGISPVPSKATIRRRADALSVELKNKLKHGPKKGKHLSTPIKKPYVADYPMQIVQFDHTLCDVLIVDSFDRTALRRPWVTLAVDIYSRCIVGYYAGLDSPSSTTVAMAVTNTILPKQDTLARLGIDDQFNWPCHGFYENGHHDNGKDFRGKALQLGCVQYRINLIFRPPGKPHFGGHIERLIGTIMGEVHLLPGTTFSNVKDRGEYPSEARATLSFDEFEKWLVLQIIIYNNKIHRSISEPPISKFLDHTSTKETLRNIPTDSFKFFVSFLPVEERTLRKEGIELFKTFYRADILYSPRTPIGSKIIIRYDPRDISKLYYTAPDGEIYDIPQAHSGRPKLSLFEHKAALKALRKKGLEQIDEETIYRAIDEQKKVLSKASKLTKKMRVNAAKLGIRQNQLSRFQPKPEQQSSTDEQSEVEASQEDAKPIKLFDVEEW
ncbi:Mu transposase C-terminal domain-containing protein [Thalassospira sp. HJ]|uniref:Mu transposase C-terminal domain-containing protein n=1 Tax=Thalassospira sp. HJ TaxID=1616823 RepID=UPI0006990D82|nr:Mu transposase C-terminal domain-containing protein [Thalassospira sp. HJ]